MNDEQRVDEMAGEVLARQAKARSEQTGETPVEAFDAVAKTDAGRLLEDLRTGSHGDQAVGRWQQDLPLDRAGERGRVQREQEAAEQEKDRAQRAQQREKEREVALEAAWEAFMRAERREIELRKAGQLAEMLGEALPGESGEALRRLAAEDQRQAAEGLVALMSNGTLTYKRLEELSASDMPARGAANRLRMTWLKERHDGWLASGRG
jgi:hypothetical protein